MVSQAPRSPTSPFYRQVQFIIHTTDGDYSTNKPWRLSSVMRPMTAQNDSQDVEVVQAVKPMTASQRKEGLRNGSPQCLAYLTPCNGRYLASLCTRSTCPCQHPRMGATIPEPRTHHHNTMQMSLRDDSLPATAPWCELSATEGHRDAIHICRTDSTSWITLRAGTSYVLTAHDDWLIDIRTTRLMSEHFSKNPRGANDRVFKEHILTIHPIAALACSPESQLTVPVSTRKRTYEPQPTHDQVVVIASTVPSSFMPPVHTAEPYVSQEMAASNGRHHQPQAVRRRTDIPSALREPRQQQQQQQLQRDTGDDLLPVTALHALNGHSLGQDLMSSSAHSDDGAGEDGLLQYGWKQLSPPLATDSTSSSLSVLSSPSSGPLSAPSCAPPGLRAVSPSSVPFASSLLHSFTDSSNTLCADLSDSLLAVGSPGSLLSTSHSTSFAATDSSFLSPSPFSPFDASTLPFPPLDLPHAALPWNNLALGSASLRSSPSSAAVRNPSQPYWHLPAPHTAFGNGSGNGYGSGSKQSRASLDPSLRDEAEENTSDERSYQQQYHRAGTFASTTVFKTAPHESPPAIATAALYSSY